MTPRRTTMSDPIKAAAARKAETGASAEGIDPKDRKKLTVGLPPDTYKALALAKIETGQDLRDLVDAALRAYSPVAQHIK